MTLKRLSPAKVNLHLSVLRKRPDGYHDLKTLLQRISLFDELTFRPLPTGIVIRGDEDKIPLGKENIVYRSVEKLFHATGYRGGVEIGIEKNIPVAAGLGGGSSNAACTLVALDEMFDFCLGKERLMRLASGLGADVPFFIFEKTAWAEGIGDILTEAQHVPSFWFVLVNPGFSVSTKEVYENLNLGLTKKNINYRIRTAQRGDWLTLLQNDLEEVTAGRHREIGEIKQGLLREGAEGALMSGSGPTVFGLFEDEGKARLASKALLGSGWAGRTVHVARSLC